MNKYKKYLLCFLKNKNKKNYSHLKLSNKKQTLFAKKLSFLIQSDIAIIEGINLIKNQAKSKLEINIYNKIIADVKNGKSLATSLEKCHGVFSNFTINIIRAGESSGTLTENLNYLALELRKKEILRKKIMGAFLYPVIITISTLGITGFLIGYIFPKIIPIFSSLKIQLPLSTRIIIGFTNIIKNDGLYILFGIIFLVTCFILMIKRLEKLSFFFDGLILNVPFIGSIIKNYNLTNICRTLGLLLKSNISITEALIITSNTINNLQFKKSFYNISHEIRRGKNISELISLYPRLFPEMLTHMISIGEKSGNLSNTLIYLSEFYENEFDDFTKNLANSIEPFLMIIMGLIVGFIAISVITPIYEITANIKK